MEGGYGGLAINGALAGLDWVARALFPHFCSGCGKEGSVACHGCLKEIEAPRAGLFRCPGCAVSTPLGERCIAAACASHALDGIVSMAAYDDAGIRSLLHSYKYEKTAEAEVVLRRQFGAFVIAHTDVFAVITAGAVVVPIPLHPLRRAGRGFNQAEMLAEVIASATDRPYRPRFLRRAFGGRPQADVERREERVRNVAGIFRATKRLAPGTRVVLVDDVATTGSTLSEAARALRAVGAEEVHAVTLLRR